MARPHLPIALAGVLGVVLNVVAIIALFFLSPVPHFYRPGHVSEWYAEALAHPTATAVSAWAFTLGLVILAAFCAGLAHVLRTAWAVVGACLFGFGAVIDAAGTMAPLAAIHVGPATGVGLLWMTLLLDAAFNGLAGLGLICFAAGLPADWPRGTRVLALVAGLASLPVAMQFHADIFAEALALSGPLWLVWVTWVSGLLLKDRA